MWPFYFFMGSLRTMALQQRVTKKRVVSCSLPGGKQSPEEEEVRAGAFF